MTVQQQLQEVGTKFTMFNNKDYSATVTNVLTHEDVKGKQWQTVHYTLDINGKKGWFKVETLESAIKTYNIELL